MAAPDAHATEAFAVAEVLRGFVKHHKYHYTDLRAPTCTFEQAGRRIAVEPHRSGRTLPDRYLGGAILGAPSVRSWLSKSHAGSRVHGYNYRAVGTKDFFDEGVPGGPESRVRVPTIDVFKVGTSPLFCSCGAKAREEFQTAQWIELMTAQRKQDEGRAYSNQTSLSQPFNRGLSQSL